jgi:hypothetical protein
MTTADDDNVEREAVLLLESARGKLTEALALLDRVWDGEAGLRFRQSRPFAFSRVAEGSSLIERGRNKLTFAATHMAVKKNPR